MPIYEYRCQDCGRQIEEIQKLSDPPLTTCPHCQGTLEKLLSAPAFQFKGSGWYVTDYADKGSKKNGDGGSSADAAGSKAGEGASAKGDSAGESKAGGAKESSSSTKKETSSGGSSSTSTSSS